MKKTLLSLTIVMAMGMGMGMGMGCSTPRVCQPYDWNGSLSELHRAGNPNTRPAIPASSGDLNTPERYVSRTCTSTPIFDNYGRFVRYHVECN